MLITKYILRRNVIFSNHDQCIFLGRFIFQNLAALGPLYKNCDLIFEFHFINLNFDIIFSLIALAIAYAKHGPIIYVK